MFCLSRFPQKTSCILKDSKENFQMYQQMRILTHVLKSDLDTRGYSYYKIAEGFRLLNWIDSKFSDTPAFYKLITATMLSSNFCKT